MEIFSGVRLVVLIVYAVVAAGVALPYIEKYRGKGKERMEGVVGLVVIALIATICVQLTVPYVKEVILNG